MTYGTPCTPPTFDQLVESLSGTTYGSTELNLVFALHKAVKRMQAVLDLHRNDDGDCAHCLDADERLVAYPCETVRLLTGHSEAQA